MQSASKTLGRKTASLVTQLYEQGRTVFDLTEASRILGAIMIESDAGEFRLAGKHCIPSAEVGQREA